MKETMFKVGQRVSVKPHPIYRHLWHGASHTPMRETQHNGYRSVIIRALYGDDETEAVEVQVNDDQTDIVPVEYVELLASADVQIKFMATPDQAAWLRERGITNTILAALEAQHEDFPAGRRKVGERDEPERNRPVQNTWREKMDNIYTEGQ